MLRVIRAEGIQHLGHFFLAGQEVRHRQRILAMLLHAQVQRLQALQMQPGIEGADRGAGGADEDLQMVVEEIFLAQHHAAKRAALAVNVFGGGMDHDVGAELHRPLQGGGGKGIVHRQPRSALVRNVRHRLDVHQRKRGIGRRLQEQQPGLGLHRRFPGCRIGAVHQGIADAEARQDLFHHMQAGAEHGLGRDHMVAGAQG